MKIESVDVSAYTIPTDLPESDGTLEWNSTTVVLVTLRAEGIQGLGYSYADKATAVLIRDKLAPLIKGSSPLAISENWNRMIDSIRNLGRPGIASMAIAAVDHALWDLKARILNLPLAELLGRVRPQIMAYGSGGFTSYSIQQLQKQFHDWVQSGFKAVKMKVGRNPDADVHRVSKAREAIGNDVLLFVDANGAYTRKQALHFANVFEDYGVTWFEEPVSSDDLDGLHYLRNVAPPGMNIAAGEYGYDATYFLRMLQSQVVDVLQCDATRCAGISGFLQTAALCEAFHIPLSAHTAPSIHTHVCCCVRPAIHVEYFHDHARIEQLFFDGAIRPIEGMLRPDLSRPGFGLKLIPENADRYRIEL